jgi:hypothetical protein
MSMVRIELATLRSIVGYDDHFVSESGHKKIALAGSGET